MSRNVRRLAALALSCAIVAAGCSADGGTGTVWYGNAAGIDGVQSVAMPYDFTSAEFDRELSALRTDVADGDLPDDLRFDYLRQLRSLKRTAELRAQANQIEVALDAIASDTTDVGTLLGYHELIPRAGSLTPDDETTSFASRVLTDRFGLTTNVLAARADGDPRAVVILLHGDSSEPAYLSGQKSLPFGDVEYHRVPGPQWRDAGYDVLIPEMQSISTEDLDQLGYSFIGLETARVLDLIHAVRTESDAPIVVAGLSRGAFVAEAVTYFDPDIAVTVSSGGGLRRRPVDDDPAGNAGFLIQLSERRVVIVAATNDTYTGWTVQAAFDHLNFLEAQFEEAGGTMVPVTFAGFHEMWPAGEIAAVNGLLSSP